MHGTRPRLLQEFAEQVAVEASQREPLRAARRGGDDVYVLSAESAFLNDAIGVATGNQSEGMHPSTAQRQPS